MAKSPSSRIPLPNFGTPTKKEKKTAKKLANQAPKKSSPGAQPAPKPKPQAAKTNRFSGMSNAQIKAEYISMSDADKKKFGMMMHKAAMANKKKGTSKPAAIKPAASKPTRSAQANTGTGRDGKFGTGTYGKGRPSDGKAKTGTRGKPLPSNPKLKSQSTKNLTGRQKIALEVAAASGGKSSNKRSASRKPVNPKKGQTYVTRTGMTMVWTGKNWKQKTK